MNNASVKPKESKENKDKQTSTQDSGESQLVEYPSRKFFRKSRISEEDDRGELDDNYTMEEVKSDSTENTDSKEAGLRKSRENSKNESQEDSDENRSQEDNENVQDPSNESIQEDDPPSQENSSESQEETVSESRGDNPDNTTSHSEEDRSPVTHSIFS